ncbi:mechanosensitive ion channel family protein [Chromobacterium vaccinii]|uniref:Mechanosensitive ion channel domain-containing protein n=3 Tax=Chromobacteriaceae TaxID=1499392 RepID=A0ABV0FHF1_9NEIS|nr:MULTISPECIES: mechanosensitive ion channel domain-containing protein [Chromobacteriaceae]AVG17352.1 mechanosensitive ion channel protein MscS [Chromobacterium vaccinii]ERE13976.1 mechanosensitive ion channel MscS [Pseudogulbenkiania ferrooxidans EGD-HP2]MCD4485174.1 mechanosensitive ion channel family protein [Chromobacterium vaccinii]MCD4502240.1 mechanosensitive ion channel family protein [Chromobacterium vaccinii]QND85240.1 Integral membrane protein [Chromobacterium vaccinii]
MHTLLDLIAFLRENYAHEITRSLLLVLTLLIIRVAVDRLLAANSGVPVEERRRWSVNTRNGLFLAGLAGIGLIWANELQTLAVSMLAFAAALILATKELIMCLSGGVVRQMSNSYGLGDHIELGAVRGRVVDIGLLSTTVMEIGPNHSSHQMTGRALTFPNSLLLSTPVIRENYMGEYVMHIINVPLAYTVPPVQAERLLMGAAEEACDCHVDVARRHMEDMAKRYLVDIPSVEPRISIQPIDEKRYQLILRIAIPARERQRIEQAILHKFMSDCYPIIEQQ